jgi:hypothetical protein
MKMKRIVLMLVGALLALGISAQTFTNGEWRVDSIITTQKDGKVVARQIMQYNAAGLVSQIDGQEAEDGSMFNTKTVYTYNDKGMTATQELYRQNGRDWTLMSKSEVTEYDDATGMPKVTETTGPVGIEGNILGNVRTKTVITKFHGSQFEEEEVYVWMGDEWTKNATATATFNSADQMVKMVTWMDYLGIEMTTEADYEYDSHGNLTKQTTTTSLGSISVITYTNEYDANDNLAKITSEFEGGVSIENYYWSRGGSTGINSAKVANGHSQWFDLSGRRLMGKPSVKGVYVKDGKKVIVK